MNGHFSARGIGRFFRKSQQVCSHYAKITARGFTIAVRMLIGVRKETYDFSMVMMIYAKIYVKVELVTSV